MIVQHLKWIAERRVVLVHPDGRRVPGHIAVGEPYVLGQGDGASNYESHCPVEITELFSPPLPAIGAGTLSALMSGLQLLGALLHAFVERGGRVLDEDGSEFRMEWLFGPLFRKVEPPGNE